MIELKVVSRKIDSGVVASYDGNKLKAYGLPDNFTGILAETSTINPSKEVFRSIYLNGRKRASKYLYNDWQYLVPNGPIYLRHVGFEEMFEILTPEEKEIVIWNLDLFAGEMNV